MENIQVITLTSEGKQVEIFMTVDELIHAWHHDIDIPTNDDAIVNCMLGGTQLYFKTFGDLMVALTGEY